MDNNSLKKPNFRPYYTKLQKNLYQIYLYISTITTNLKLNKTGHCFYS